MAPARKDTSDGDDFFTSQSTFNVDDDGEQRVRRRKRGGKQRPQPIQKQNVEKTFQSKRNTLLEHGEIPVQPEALDKCPGCGTGIEEGEYVDVLISFVTGAADYLAGDPIRTQAVQALKQQAKALDLPEPYDDWLLEVCTRLEAQVVRYVEARRDLIVENVDSNLRKELMGEMYEQIRDEIEAQVRHDIETEMWEQFEQMNREREQGQ